MLSCVGWLLALLLTSYRYIWIHIWSICMTSKNSVKVSLYCHRCFSNILPESQLFWQQCGSAFGRNEHVCPSHTLLKKYYMDLRCLPLFSSVDPADCREHSGSHCSKIILALGHYHSPVTVPMWLASHRPEQILASPNAQLYSKEMCFGKRALIQHHSLFS